MRHTLLLKSILEKAYEVKNEFHGEQLCTLHLAAAVADFCNTDYTGFALSDTNYPSVRFEEERLRYIFSKEVRGESFLKKCLSYNWENRGHGNVFDITKCENIAALHGDDILSVDVVFLCVLKELKKTHSTFVHSVIESDEDVLALLLEVDTNIYDYVIDKIENICYALREKSSRAAAIRDWKPAKKFADPDELSALLFGKIGRQISDNSVTIKIPKFFGAADLKVSIHRVGNRYYIHDNGCAVRHLSRRTKDKKKCERALKKVCHDCHIDKGSITGSFINAFQFVY